MFNAKVFLCGVALVVLVTGGLLCQARALAVQRERAEAERRQAEAQRALKEQKARPAVIKAERLLRDEADNAGQGFGQNLEKALAELAELRAAQLQRFLQERQKLSELMKKLEMEEREVLAKIDAKANELQSQLKNRPAGQGAPDGDKLDRILERLDRIEQRLERLERAGRKK